MRNWEELYKSLGTCKAGKRYMVNFKFINPTREIEEITTSCGCVKTKFKDNILSLSYKPTKVPNHLWEQGYYNALKSTYILYTDGTKDILQIYARVVN